MIQFINCINILNNNKNNDNEYNKYEYENIGFIRLSLNKESNFQEREMRKVLVKIYNTNRIKLLIHENYTNSLNPYNQVGIVSIKFLGNFTNEGRNNDLIINNDCYKRIRKESNKSDKEDKEKNNEKKEKDQFIFHKNENKNYFNKTYKNEEIDENSEEDEENEKGEDEEVIESDENKEENMYEKETNNNNIKKYNINKYKNYKFKNKKNDDI